MVGAMHIIRFQQKSDLKYSMLLYNEDKTMTHYNNYLYSYHDIVSQLYIYIIYRSFYISSYVRMQHLYW